MALWLDDESTMMETWRVIAGFEGLYEVSDLGRVRSLPRFHCSGRIRKATLASGYLCLQLGQRGARHTYLVHRLVARAFIPNPENKLEVNHIKQPKTNNCVSNLEWVTALENGHHAAATGLAVKGEQNASHILTEVEVIELRALRAQGWTYIALGFRYGVHPVTASDAARGKCWKHI
jgi:hypothetical protein